MSGMTKWEYAEVEVWPKTLQVQLVTYGGTKGWKGWDAERNARIVEAKQSENSLLDVLAELGKDGWELATDMILSGDSTAIFLLKRPAAEPGEVPQL
jgi:hypothetical protein